jgi:catechol 2,3-dioxygenase-like lactoylglutathione lyase family enzyme
MSNDPKSMAKRLRADLAEHGVQITHSQTLELLAHLHGHRDWNTMAAIEQKPADAVEHPQQGGAIPIFRMFDVERTLAFYVGFLGFRKTWEHRFADHAPLYLEIERDGVRLHLSEHHGDATPGSAVIIEIDDADALQQELIGRDYPYARPGVEQQDWGFTVTVGDPASNRVVFLQRASERIDRIAEHGAPIENEITVPVDPITAYEGFVDLGRWWDPQKSPDPATWRGVDSGGVGEPVVFLHGTSRFPIGTVTSAEPGVLYEQSFTLAVDPEYPTTLSARFSAVDGGTRVTLVHGGWTAGNASERAKFTEWPDLLNRYAASLDR